MLSYLNIWLVSRVIINEDREYLKCLKLSKIKDFVVFKVNTISELNLFDAREIG